MSAEKERPFATNADYCDAGMGEYPLPSKVLLYACSALVWVFSKLYWHWTCDGKVPFPRRDGSDKGRVVVANHASMLDPAILVIYPTLKGTRIRPLYKSELDGDGKGVAPWFLTRMGAIPLKRASADLKAVKRAVNAIKRGEDVLIFPEGTRIKDPEARPELFGGFALIAQMADCDIVPCAIEGTQNICPTGKGFIRPARVRLRFGDPISFSDFGDMPRREKAAAMEKAVMSEVYRMREELRAGKGAGISPAQ